MRDHARETLDHETFGPPPGATPARGAPGPHHHGPARFTGHGSGRAGFSPEQGGTGDHGGSVTAFEMLGHLDLSLFVKAGVQFGLFDGAIANRGTARHHAAYLPRVLDGSLLGCFAMTEHGSGSDVQALLTTATHDPDTDEIVIHTPSPDDRKDYIGNAARDGEMAAVSSSMARGTACTASWCRSATRAGRRCAA